MRLKSIKLKSNKDGEAIPSKITVEMTVEEALWIAIVSGKQRGVSPHNDIFSCMNGDVFNKYWDDGATDAMKEFNIETPPVVYTNT